MEFEDLEFMKIDSDEEDIRHRKEAYVRSKGWQASSSTPGGYWMWFKEIDGKHYGCGLNDAFGIQKIICSREYAAANPEEFID